MSLLRACSGGMLQNELAFAVGLSEQGGANRPQVKGNRRDYNWDQAAQDHGHVRDDQYRVQHTKEPDDDRPGDYVAPDIGFEDGP